MPLPAIEGYEFGPYRIDTGERLLHRGDELISLPPKVAGTLLVLVRSAGRMVDRVESHNSWAVGTMPLPAIEGYEFGPYRIDTGERLLHRGDELISLPPKVAGTLLVLVRSAGRMVDKGDLMKAVWPDTFVEEGALTRNISLLRKTLGDTGDEAAYIETIPRRGYRFVAPVRTVAVEPAGAAIA